MTIHTLSTHFPQIAGYTFLYMELRKYLPSTQFSLVVGAILLSALFIFAATLTRTPRETGGVALAPEVTNTEGFKDTDGDGLRDWEETLYGTDPLSADTNGDGVSDRDEAQATLASAEAVKNEKFPLEVDAGQNLTSTIGQTLFATYAEKQKQGGAEDVLSQNAIIAEALSRAQTLQESARTYAPSDLSLTPDSAAAYRAYGNAFVQTSDRFPRAGYDQALVTFALYAESGSAKDAAELAAIERDFAGLVSALLALPVPQHFAYMHAQTVSSFEKIRVAVANMRAFKDDPVRALLGADQLRTDGGTSIKLLITIAREFASQGVSFSAADAGADWKNLEGIAFSDILAPSTGSAETP